MRLENNPSEAQKTKVPAKMLCSHKDINHLKKIGEKNIKAATGKQENFVLSYFVKHCIELKLYEQED